MSDETTSKSGKPWSYVVGAFVSLLLCYVLSIGPAAVLEKRRVVSGQVLGVVYGPILWLEGNGFSKPIKAYCEFWVLITATPIW